MYTPEELKKASKEFHPTPSEEDAYDDVNYSTEELAWEVQQAFTKGAHWATQQLITNPQQRTAHDLGLTPEEAKDYGPKDTDPDADQG